MGFGPEFRLLGRFGMTAFKTLAAVCLTKVDDSASVSLLPSYIWMYSEDAVPMSRTMELDATKATPFGLSFSHRRRRLGPPLGRQSRELVNVPRRIAGNCGKLAPRVTFGLADIKK